MQSLDELTQYVRETLPQSKKITHLQQNESAGAITFQWQGRLFLIRRTLEVLEIKGTNLFITGASTLMQTALMKRNKNERVLDSSLEVLRKVEEMIKTPQNVGKGLELLATVKATIAKLAN